MITLDKIPLKQKFLITGFTQESQQFRKKLLSMGITPGCEIEVIRIAPLGDPIQVKLRGFQLCLRLKEAAIIQVEN